MGGQQTTPPPPAFNPYARQDPTAIPTDPLKAKLPKSYADQYTESLKPYTGTQYWKQGVPIPEQEALQPSSMMYDVVNRDLGPGYRRTFGPKYGDYVTRGVAAVAPLMLGSVGGAEGAEGEIASELEGGGAPTKFLEIGGGQTKPITPYTGALGPERDIVSVPKTDVQEKMFHHISIGDDPGGVLQSKINKEGMRAGWFAKGDPDGMTLDDYLQDMEGGVKMSRQLGSTYDPYADAPSRVLMVDPKDLPPPVGHPEDDYYIPNWTGKLTMDDPFVGPGEFANKPPAQGAVVPPNKLTELVGPDPKNPDNVLVRPLKSGQTTPFPNLGGTGRLVPPEYQQLQRLEAPGVIPDPNKPQGLYLSPGGVESPHLEPGSVRHDFEGAARNPLDVSDVGPLPIRQQAIDSGAGVKALKKLQPDLFDELKSLPKSKLLARASQIEPNVDFTKYADQQEILEALGAKFARDAGYDALLHDDPQAPEFSEYVALHPSAVRQGRTNYGR